MESYDQGYGCIIYRTTITAGPPAELEVAAVHDFGFVYLDRHGIGIFDRRHAGAKILVPARKAEAQLDILVEPMGRINFGPEMVDHKGIIAPVKLAGKTLESWEIYRLPLDYEYIAALKFTPGKDNGPAFWRGIVNLEKPGDTFLDMHGFGKGDLWVNRHCLGRYWNIGPSQTAYVPGCWLHPGENEVIVLDLEGPEHPAVAGLAKPVLDELHPEKDFAKTRRPAVKVNLDATTVAISGSFAPGTDTQEIKFTAPLQKDPKLTHEKPVKFIMDENLNISA